MFVTVNIATDNCTFQNVTDAFVRVCSAKKNKVFEPEHVLAEYPLDGYIKTSTVNTIISNFNNKY